MVINIRLYSVCFQINLRLILVSGKTKEFLFSASNSAGEIAQYVFDNWPEGEYSGNLTYSLIFCLSLSVLVVHRNYCYYELIKDIFCGLMLSVRVWPSQLVRNETDRGNDMCEAQGRQWRRLPIPGRKIEIKNASNLAKIFSLEGTC